MISVERENGPGARAQTWLLNPNPWVTVRTNEKTRRLGILMSCWWDLIVRRSAITNGDGPIVLSVDRQEL